MRTLQVALMVAVLAGVPLAGDSFVPSASDTNLMNRVASFQLLAKGFEPFVGPSDGYETSYITLRVSIRNNSDKDLQIMTGDLQFNDAKGTAVDSEFLDYYSVIKAHSTVTADFRAKYNGLMSENVNLRNAQVSDLRTVFYPGGMYFTDGVLLGSVWNSLYCRNPEHRGRGPCDFVAHPYQ